MNFDERLARTQAKLEEVKAKINTSMDSAKKANELKKNEVIVKLAKMDAAISDFNKDVEAQVLCDVTDMKNEVKSDLNAIDEAMDQADDKVAAAFEKAGAKIDAAADKIDAAADKFDAEMDARIDDDAATIEGDINAAEENFRLAKERYEGKLNSTRLKVQMHKEEAKARIEASKAEFSKAAQEERILNLLDYADDCQMIALAYAMEAELAVLDACDEIEDYEAKYGEFDK